MRLQNGRAYFTLLLVLRPHGRVNLLFVDHVATFSCSYFKILFSSVNFFFFVHVTGSFAVICLMVAQVCEREVGSLILEPSPTPGNGSSTSPPPDTTNSLWTPVDAIKLEIAVSLSMLVGIIQVIQGLS